MSSVEAQLEKAKERLASMYEDDPEYEKVHEEVHRLAAQAYYERMMKQ